MKGTLLLLVTVKGPTNILQTLYASFNHSSYIVFIHIIVMQKGWKTDKNPGRYSKPCKVVSLHVWRYCRTPFQTMGYFYCYWMYNHVHLAKGSPELEISNL
jgi:hypothetical protein